MNMMCFQRADKFYVILSFRLNIPAATYMYIPPILFCVFRFIQLTNKIVSISKNQLIMIMGLSNGAVKKITAPGSFYIITIIIVSRHPAARYFLKNLDTQRSEIIKEFQHRKLINSFLK